MITPHQFPKNHCDEFGEAISSFKPNGIGVREFAGEGRGDETDLPIENLRTPHEPRESTD